MKYDLFENGLDSIMLSVDLYWLFIDHLKKNEYEESNRYLKATIMNLQNASELLLKYKLMTINPLLIFNDFKDKKLLKIYSDNSDSDQLVKELIKFHNKIRTIGYSVTLDRIVNFMDVPSNSLEFLQKIGIWRNQITHLGINKDNEVYEVVRIINGVLVFLKDYLIYDFEDGTIKRKMGGYYDFMDEVWEIADDIEKQIWTRTFQTRIEDLVTIIKKCFENTDFKQFIEDNCEKHKIHNLTESYGSNIWIEFFTREKGIFNFIFNIRSTLEAILIIDESQVGPLYFVIDYKIPNKPLIYFYNTPLLLNDLYEIEEKFWIQDYKNKICKKISLSFENFKKSIEEILMRRNLHNVLCNINESP